MALERVDEIDRVGRSAPAQLHKNRGQDRQPDVDPYSQCKDGYPVAGDPGEQSAAWVFCRAGINRTDLFLLDFHRLNEMTELIW